MATFVRKLAAFLLISIFVTGGALAAGSYPSLGNSKDSALQQQLERSLGKLGLSKAVSRGQLSVALVDITDIEHPRYAAVNGNRMMYAASLPKIAILFGAFKRIEDGAMALDTRTRKDLVSMIRYSSNPAATRMLNRVGKQYLANLLQSPRYRLYDRTRNGGLWVGKPYGRGVAWKRDPLHNLSHGATSFQVARFYYLLETGQLLTPALSREMKTMLGKPGINHKFVRGLRQHRPGSSIYRKSGSWRTFHADSAIVERNGRRYIAVAIANHSKGGVWMKKLIVSLDDLVTRNSRGTVALLK